jgi:hypothetical protein
MYVYIYINYKLRTFRKTPIYYGGANGKGSSFTMIHTKQGFPDNRAWKGLPGVYRYICVYISTYLLIYMCIYIHICIWRNASLIIELGKGYQVYIDIFVCIYLHTFLYTCVYIFIYAYEEMLPDNRAWKGLLGVYIQKYMYVCIYKLICIHTFVSS